MKRGVVAVDERALELKQAIVTPPGRPAGFDRLRVMAGLLARGFPPIAAFPVNPEGPTSGSMANGYPLTVAGAATALMLTHRTAFPFIPAFAGNHRAYS